VQVFSKRRQVEVYTMSDIKTHLALDREKLISLALLLGSDFTEVPTASPAFPRYGCLPEV
jgi:hypothetical protein